MIGDEVKRILALGTVHRGQLVISRRDQFDAELRQLNGPVLLTVERETRTLRQNAFYHVWNGIIAKELGWTPSEVHEFNKRECNERVKTYADRETGELVEVRFGASTADLPIDAFSEFMERVRQYWLMEHNIDLPDAKSDPDAPNESGA